MLEYNGLLYLFGTRYFTTRLNYKNITYFFTGVTEANWKLKNNLVYKNTTPQNLVVENFESNNIEYNSILFLVLTGNVIVVENNKTNVFGNVKIIRDTSYDEINKKWWIRTINFDSAILIN